ncbi:MAG: hypothetical protein GQ529_07575 [Methyloprofundus sp.]|nr:hypothetical protein [Methyloprofundus sp.]
MTQSRIIMLISIGLLIGSFFYFGLGEYLTLESLKAQQVAIEQYRAANPTFSVVWYVSIYILVTSLSLPGATILTLAGAAVFGLVWGTIIVSFASTMGATLAFLAARFLFRDSVESKFGDRLNTINEGITRDGIFYLLSLRLVPLFPFFMINMLMGLTSMKPWTFYWVSQVGMLAGTIVYVNAGTQLASIESLSDILSPALLASFALLGVFPIIAKKIVDSIQANKVKK